MIIKCLSFTLPRPELANSMAVGDALQIFTFNHKTEKLKGVPLAPLLIHRTSPSALPTAISLSSIIREMPQYYNNYIQAFREKEGIHGHQEGNSVSGKRATTSANSRINRLLKNCASSFSGTSWSEVLSTKHCYFPQFHYAVNRRIEEETLKKDFFNSL